MIVRLLGPSLWLAGLSRAGVAPAGAAEASAAAAAPNEATRRLRELYDAEWRWRQQEFVRVREPAVIAAASKFAGRQLTDPVSVLAAVREWKNSF